MRTRSSSAFLLLSASAIIAVGCSVDVDGSVPNGPAAPAPTSLREAKIPSDFTFASTRGVGIQISVNLANLPADKEFPVEVWNLRGELLAAAKPDAKGKVHFEYPLPLGDKKLVIKVGDQQQTITLDDNDTASATFE